MKNLLMTLLLSIAIGIVGLSGDCSAGKLYVYAKAPNGSLYRGFDVHVYNRDRSYTYAGHGKAGKLLRYATIDNLEKGKGYNIIVCIEKGRGYISGGYNTVLRKNADTVYVPIQDLTPYGQCGR